MSYIPELVNKLIKKFHTTNPFEIAEALNVKVFFKDIGALKGYYCVLNRSRYIVINSEIPEEEQRVVCAHELGHDQLHRRLLKCPAFMDSHVFDVSLKPEREANMFAASLLISDEDILENRELTTDNIAHILGVDHNFVSLKIQTMHS